MKTPGFFSSILNKQPMQGSLFALFLLLLVAFSACGTNQFAERPTNNLHAQARNVPTKQIDPCSLVTKTQVEQVFKTPLTLTQRLASSAPCGYFSPDFAISADIDLQIYQDVAAARQVFHEPHNILVVVVGNGDSPLLSGGDLHVTYRDIANLGDRAMLIIAASTVMLYVQKDNGILSIAVVNYEQPKSLTLIENEEQQLAQLAVQKL